MFMYVEKNDSVEYHALKSGITLLNQSMNIPGVQY